MFELLFKYPVSLFQKGHFVFLTPWPLWLMAAGILAAAGLLFWHVRRNHGMLSGLRPVAIWLLETALIALLLFLLWHPALSVATLRPQQNVVAVLLDDSHSMTISDESGTRLARAQSILDGGLLQALGTKFQVRLYKFGADAQRMQKPVEATGAEPATRIGSTLERVLAESSSLPLGAIVVLTDGADNAGGIDLDTIAAIRRQRIPIHTVGLGLEHPQKDIEVTDAVLPARALPQSRLTALVTMQSYGMSGTKAKLTVRDGAKVIASQDVTLKGDGVLQTESITFNADKVAGPKSLEIGVDPAPGESNALNNKVSRLVNVQARKPRILYFDGEPQYEYKFVRRAMDDNPEIVVFSMVRTTQNKIYRQPCPAGGCPEGFKGEDKEELAAGFPAKPEELNQFQGLMLANVEAGYFTPTQQQLIHDFVDRRGGGLLFLGGRASLSDGGYPNSPLADLVPTKLPPNKGTFHRDFSKVELTQAGRESILTRLEDNPERNVARWKDIPMVADYQEIGEPKPGATVLLNVTPPSRSAIPLLVTAPYGHGRTAVFATGGSWRWKMWMPHDDKTHATFWQQMFRHLVTDTPGQVTVTTPKTVLSDETRVPLRVEVRDKEYKPLSTARVQARFLAPDGSSATVELAPQPLEEGVYTGEWTAEKPGTYVAEILAGQEQQEIGRDSLGFRREDGVAENFHTGQNRELLQKLSDQTGGKYYTAADASKLANEISYSQAGITSRETRDLWDMPILLLLAFGIRGSEWLLRRKWGVV